MKYFTIMILAILAARAEARPGQSTITFGESDKVVSGTTKHRNFRADLDALNKTHDVWKKAHLNETLYVCQRNAERVATLARKVSDRIDASEKETLKTSKAVEKTVEGVVGADATEMPATFTSEQTDALRAKVKQLTAAQKQAQLLERLSGQVMKFYQSDIPKESAVDGNCVTQYTAAVQQGAKASEAYHSDAAALSMKLDRLKAAAEVALKTAEKTVMVASQ
jgi:hypothetical protein